jgi:ATP-dependent DNA helicase RecG
LRPRSGGPVVRLLQFFPSQQALLAVGRRVRVLGMVRGGWMGVEMVHPQVRAAEPQRPPARTLTPIYPTTAGLPQHWLRRRIERALGAVDLSDTLPEAIRTEQALPELAQVLRYLHHPPLDADVQALLQRHHPIWERLKFDELLAQQLALRMARLRRQTRTAPAPSARSRAGLTQALLESLPFRLTGAQQRAWNEVRHDLGGAAPMNRLIQGDVDRGKTVIEALAAAFKIEHGWRRTSMGHAQVGPFLSPRIFR